MCTDDISIDNGYGRASISTNATKSKCDTNFKISRTNRKQNFFNISGLFPFFLFFHIFQKNIFLMKFIA